MTDQGTDKETNPTLENVLPEYREDPLDTHGNYGKAIAPFWVEKSVAQEHGVIASVPGGFRCPWCKSVMTEVGTSYVAVCDKNPKHVVEWTPWGG